MMLKNILSNLHNLNALFKRLFIAGSFAVLFILNGSSQTQLELAGASYTGVPLGLTTANQTATLLENTIGSTFLTFNPTITVTASISNQQFNGIATNRVSTGKAINFGGRTNSITPVATQVPVYNSLNTVDNPSNNQYTANPYGPVTTGIDVAANSGFYFYNSVDELFTTSAAVGGRFYFGDITLTFSQPVSNPVIHILGLGSNVLFGVTNRQGFSTELELQTGGVTLSKLSGNNELNVTANKVLNNAAVPTFDCGSGAACGSVKVSGTNITTLTFRVYVRGDGNGQDWSHPAINAGDEFMMSMSMNTPASISGNVFSDANGLTDNTVNGTGTNVGGTLYANLVDSNNKVVASTPIASNGAYLFSAISAGNYTMVLSTTQGVQGAIAPAPSLPSSYIYTGENVGAGPGNDGTINGILPITVTLTNITNANFGIYQCPAVNPIITASGVTSACLGGGLILSSTVVPNYQWYKDGVAIVGAINQTYTPIVSGTYTMSYTSSNGICNITSNAIIVNISYAVTPTITPADTANICLANNDKICPAVWGFSNYQWYKNGALIPAPNGTASCFYPTTAGNYTLTAQNGSGCWSLPSASVYVKIDTVCNGSVTSGGGGGVESKSLGDVISVRLYGNAFNSVQEVTGYTNATPFVKSGTIVNGNNSLKLVDLVPTAVINTNKAYFTTPKDLIDITNAIEVLSVDYTNNNTTKAVAFGTKTLGEVYSHTKPICDRLKEGKLLEVKKVKVNGYDFIASTIRQRSGETEYCINFSIGVKAGRNNYSLQSNWMTDNYVKEDTLYNFQLWAISLATVQDMAKAVLNKVLAVATLQPLANNTMDMPKVFIESVMREKTNLQLVINNPTNATNCSFKIAEKLNEDATENIKLITVSLLPNAINKISIPVADAYENNVYLNINGITNDLVYMSDGSWNISYDKSNTSIKKFNVTNEGFSTNANEYPLFRKVAVTATTKDYVAAYKLVKGGGLEKTFEDYKIIKFNASATGVTTMKVTLVKKGITDWANQYSYTLPITNIDASYAINISQFVSKANANSINLKDITAINFTWENNRGGLQNITTSINKLRFSKEVAATIATIEEGEIGVYPNPNQGKFVVNFTANETQSVLIKIVEIGSGKVIFTQAKTTVKGVNKIDINLNKQLVAAGLYLITIEGDSYKYKPSKIVINNP